MEGGWEGGGGGGGGGGDGGSEVSPRCCSIGALMPPFIDFEEHHRVAQDRDNTLLQEGSPLFFLHSSAQQSTGLGVQQ